MGSNRRNTTIYPGILAMHNKIGFLSIRNKLGLAVLAVFSLVLILLTAYTYRLDRQQNLERAITTVKGMNGFYFDSINTLMLGDGMDEREALYKKFLELPNVLNMRVIRGPDVTKRFGEGLDTEKAVDELDKRAMQGESILRFGENNGQRMITVIEPYRATHDTRGTDCLECHKHIKEGTVLGAIRIEYSLKKADEAVITQLWKNFGMMGGAILVGLLALMLLLDKLIVKPLNNAKDFATAVSHGDLNFAVDINSSDEMGQLIHALTDMQENLKHRIDKDKQLLAEGQRITAALNKASANIMVTDAEHNIIFVNEAITKMFKAAQTDIQQTVNDFHVDRLVGSRIDALFQQSAQPALHLEQINMMQQATIEVGGHTLKIVANPVTDEAGERIGTVLEWEDRTNQLAVEQEIDHLVESAINGDLGTRLKTEGKSGFFLQLGKGINKLLDQLSSVFDDIDSVMAEVANGDLTQTMTRHYSGTFEAVKNNINSTISNMEKTVSQLRQVSDVVGTTAEEINAGNTNLSDRTEQQTSALEQIAASVEELTSTVKNNADNTRQANDIAAASREQAEKGGQVVAKAVEAMTEINESSDRIAEIISVIDEIAFQTNLLALNASVEAARAGEQGRGFAVVASEVRNLASRSAGAAREIKELIQDSTRKVLAGSELVNDTGDNLAAIVEGVKKVDKIIGEIATASQEQALGIEQVRTAITDMDDMTQQNAALAEQTSAASVSMANNARKMRETISIFRVSIQQMNPTTETTPAAMDDSDRHILTSPSQSPQPATRLSSKPVSVPEAIPSSVNVEEDEWEEF